MFEPFFHAIFFLDLLLLTILCNGSQGSARANDLRENILVFRLDAENDDEVSFSLSSTRSTRFFSPPCHSCGQYYHTWLKQSLPLPVPPLFISQFHRLPHLASSLPPPVPTPVLHPSTHHALQQQTRTPRPSLPFVTLSTRSDLFKLLLKFTLDNQRTDRGSIGGKLESMLVSV